MKCSLKNMFQKNLHKNIDDVIRYINQLGRDEIWNDISPVWARPQYESYQLFQSDRYFQVVGHTPLREITKSNNVISCDVFSLDRNRHPLGTQEFVIIDTINGEYTPINSHS